MTPELKKLIEGLNEDLSHEYQAVVMYSTYAALVSGPHRLELKAFFESEIPDELGHASFLADKIVALGGSPATTVPPVPVAADNRQMLENALAGEIATLERYGERIKQAEKAGEMAVQIQLEDLIVDETGHRDDMRRMLKDWE